MVYLSSAWLLWQIVEIAGRNFNAPGWIMRVFLLILAAGFFIMMVAAWMLELTPQGIRLKKNVAPGSSISRKTGRQLTRGIIMILSMAIVLFLTEKFREEAWVEHKTGGTEIKKNISNGVDDCGTEDQSSTKCEDEAQEN